jgi:hypothetical protein
VLKLSECSHEPFGVCSVVKQSVGTQDVCFETSKMKSHPMVCACANYVCGGVPRVP